MKTHFEKFNEILLKRSVIYPNSEIYGNVAGFYDYGSVGAEIKRRFTDSWIEYFLSLNDNFHLIETTLIMPERVFKGSGHLENFNDPVAECVKCNATVRADHILEEFLGEKFEGMSPDKYDKLIKKHKIVCPSCHSKFKKIENFTLMFPMQIGAGKSKITSYLRPETAQGPFVAFKREYRANREKLPLGLAMVGKAFRNEISPRQLTIRQREFTQAELQIFFDPNQMDSWEGLEEFNDYKLHIMRVGDKKQKSVPVKKVDLPAMYKYFMVQDQKFVESLGLLEKFRFLELNEEERAFYNKIHFDLEVLSPSFDKYIEIAGLHYRTDHDLGGHQKESGDNLAVTVDGRKFVPHVLEISWGVDRAIFTMLDNSFTEEENRTYFKLPFNMAPWDVGVYPLVNKKGLPEKAREVFTTLKQLGLKCLYDNSGSIGRRYARADEVGVPFGVTIDFDTLEDNTVTLRNRDTTKQDRVTIPKLVNKIREAEWKSH